MLDFTITRSVNSNYLFNLKDNKTNDYVLIQETFETIQDYLGIIPEDYSKSDDMRYMLLL